MGILPDIVTQHTIVMTLANHRPHRAIIRCKAKMQLLESDDDSFDWNEPPDDTLLKELAANLFQSNQHREFFEADHSKQTAKDVEDQLARKLADTYRSISKRQQDPIVQVLNALL